MSHKVTIQVLPGISCFITVQQIERSVHELLNTSDLLTNKSLTNVRLSHPPIAMLKEGGGEQLLNKSSLIHQVKCYKGVNKKAVMPHSLMTYAIDPEEYDKEEVVLYQFLFSQLELLGYQKKIGKNMLWETVMRKIESDSYLKSIIEDKLFDGESLAPRHYQSLFSPLCLSPSSINHKVSDVRYGKSVENGKDSKGASVDPGLFMRLA
ncbi:hypothetical protein [Halomonas cibimaris]|uniref:hypothetical protein n=1 Tax=Halomonas cibimaris TaxID=657012 RepID=UPI0031D52881